ncbi:MAG: hypothetical protein P8049_06030 [Gemmatimonadota bacterium]|jgi:hypothetical protein
MIATLFFPSRAAAQQNVSSESTEGSTGAVVGGAALGMYSGTVLATVGSLIPCTRTYEGPACVRPAAIAGGLIAGISGASLGAADAERVEDYFVAGVIGAGVGGAALLAVQPFLERWSWADVGAGALVGGAIAASGTGAAIGFGAGAIAGLATWQLIPAMKLPDAAAVTLFGLAAGGIGGWVFRAIDAHDGAEDAESALLSFTIRTN